MRPATSWFKSGFDGTGGAEDRALEMLRRPAFAGLVNGLVILLFAAWLAQLTWRAAAPESPPAPVGLHAGASGAAFNLAALQNAALFGRSADSVPALEDLPVSSLSVVVYGIVATARGGLALISAADGPPEPIFQGQEIQSGVVLDAVLTDRIVIRRGAVKEYVLLEIVGASVDSTQAPPGPAAVAGAVDVDRHLRSLSAGRYSITRELIQAQMRSPAMWRNAALVPQPGGGFLVRDIVPGSIYEKLGLRAGDVITGVNGEPINSVEDALKLYQRIGQLNEVQLELRRGTAKQQLNYVVQ